MITSKSKLIKVAYQFKYLRTTMLSSFLSSLIKKFLIKIKIKTRSFDTVDQGVITMILMTMMIKIFFFLNSFLILYSCFYLACQKIAQSRAVYLSINHRSNISSNFGFNRFHSINNLTNFNSSATSKLGTFNLNSNSSVDHHQASSYQQSNLANKPSTLYPVPPKRVESKMDSIIKPASCGSESYSNNSLLISGSSKSKDNSKDSTNPSLTPTTARKTRRRSNLFPQLSNKNKTLEEKNKNGELGIGRTIPLRQGYLYKKSKKSLNKDWKKKYVTLTSDGCLTYHPTLHDYMGDIHGKNIPLKHTTVKIPGQKPRGARPLQSNQLPFGVLENQIDNDLNSLTIGSG